MADPDVSSTGGASDSSDHADSVSEPSAVTALTGATSRGADGAVEISTNTISSVASSAPTPIDWLHPPAGQAPFGLPEEYAAFDWIDVGSATLDSSYDESSCARVYDHVQGGIGFIECEGDYERWSCRCYTDSQTYDWAYLPPYFVDTSANTGEACRLGAAICLTDLPGPGECYDSGRWEGSSAQSCGREDWCEYGFDTPHGGVTHTALMPFIHCSVDFESEASAYVCGTSDAELRITGLLDAVPERQIHDTCDVGARVFHYGVDPDSEGEPTCQPVGAVTVEVSDGQERYCSARYRCTRSATTLGEVISLTDTEQTVECARHENGWSCWCGDESSSYTWPDITDGVTACNHALDECMSHPVP